MEGISLHLNDSKMTIHKPELGLLRVLSIPRYSYNMYNLAKQRHHSEILARK